MVRIGKQEERRMRYPRKTRKSMHRDKVAVTAVSNTFKEHVNAVEGDLAASFFIPKIK